MPNANDILADLQTKNQHDLESFKNALSSTAILFFKRMEKMIQKEIASFYSEDGELIGNKSDLKKKIKTIQDVELNKMKDKIFSDVEKVLGVEADVYKKQLENTFESVSDFVKIHGVDSAKLKKDFEKSRVSMDKGKTFTISAFWKTFTNAVSLRTAQNIDSAYQLGKSRKQFNDDLATGFRTGENQLDATSRTLIEQAFIVALLGVNNANKGVVSGYTYDAILDARTSDICRSLNGLTWIEEFPDKSTLPYRLTPPQHYRCRSFITPITKSYLEMGITPEDLTLEQKGLLSGELSEVESYNSWFMRQPNSVQRDVLGSVRYNAFKQSDIAIDKFYNSGSKLTLSQLRSKGLSI